jgi:transketolase
VAGHGGDLGAGSARDEPGQFAFVGRGRPWCSVNISRPMWVRIWARMSGSRWQDRFDAWAQANPEHKALFNRLQSRQLPQGWADSLPSWEPDAKGMATHKASGKVLATLAPVLPELWGGSADLAESNITTMPDVPSFGPESISTGTWKAGPYARTLHFGAREHAMGAILNGIAPHGPTRRYGGTFLVLRPAVRLAALSDLCVDPGSGSV